MTVPENIRPIITFRQAGEILLRWPTRCDLYKDPLADEPFTDHL